MRKISIANCFDCPLCKFIAETDHAYARYECSRSGKDVSKCKREHKLHNECPLEEDVLISRRDVRAIELDVHDKNK